MTKVAVVGYGTIGRRIADALLKQGDMKVAGIVKETPDYRARIAVERGFDLYVTSEEKRAAFQEMGVSVRGTLPELLGDVDVVIDATTEGVGAENKRLYERAGVKAIFQGGEEPEVAEVSFVAQCNFEEAVGKRFARVVSCNTTGLCRVLGALDRSFGIARAVAVLARRAADPHETSKGPIDAILPDPVQIPSHHAHDVQTVLRGIPLVTLALKVPATHMHLTSLIVDLKRAATTSDVLSALEETPRLLLVDSREGFKSTSHLMDYARELGRSRGDLYEVAVWRDSVRVDGRSLYMFYAVHQESIVIPENMDAVRALMGGYSRAESMARTDTSLGIKHGIYAVH
jgi:glyceraldehyde-3-phosphate dehydrogenase (NAD(P))